MEQMFPPCQAERISDPCVITDKEGVILLWYLLGLMSQSRQVCTPTAEMSRSDDLDNRTKSGNQWLLLKSI
jgi:hypothetical protein